MAELLIRKLLVMLYSTSLICSGTIQQRIWNAGWRWRE